MGKSWLSEYGLHSDGWETPLRADIRRAYEVAEGSHVQRVLACCRSAGVQAMIVYRFGQWALMQPNWARWVLDPVYVLLNFVIKAIWGIELSRYARIGAGLHISHFGGITVSPLAEIGKYCNLSQSISISTGLSGEREGAPIVGDDVYIAPGARLFGRIRVGNNVKVGANAVVYRDIPDNAVVVLDPGFKIVSYKGNREPIGSPVVRDTEAAA
jgi:serine O-acetyltransferase